MEPESFCCAADGSRIEIGALQQDGARVRFDLGIRSAHYPRQRDRHITIADKQILRCKFSFHAIECREFFNLLCGSYDDLPRRQTIQVESVQRLSGLEHDVVGYVDNIVDRANTARSEERRVGRGGKCEWMWNEVRRKVMKRD